MKPKPVHFAIEYLVWKSPRPLLRTQIVKLLYLADIESVLLYGTSITGAHYIKDYQGPNAVEIEQAAREMLEREVAVQENVSMRGHLYYLHSRGPSPRFDPELEPEHTRLLDYVLSEFASRPLDTLKQQAYCTLPWLRAVHQGLKTPLDLAVARDAFKPTRADRRWVRAHIRAARARVKPAGTPEEQAESALRVFEETADWRREANTLMLGDP